VTSPATLAIGSHQIDCVATNVVGSDSGSFTVTVTAGNRAPTAAAGGPYAVAEGQPVHLDGSGSSDPDGDTLTYSWDVNGDGTFTDATGAAPVLSWSQLSALGVSDGPGTFHPQVRLSDGKAAAVTSTATTLTVLNTAPVAFIGGSASAAGGLKVTLVFSATDPSVPDQQAGFSYLVHWGDGTSNGPVHGGDAWSGTHTYAAAGSYAVTVTATDKDGAASDPATRTIAVTSRVTDICGTGKTLFVGGSAGDDVITVRPGAVDGTVAVVVDGVAQTVPSGFARLVVRAGAGNDSVTVTGLSSVRRMLYGEAGDDVLSGGGGPSVLVGGDGRDTLAGGSARDVIIGGAGVDIATGGAGDDLLIDGATAWDAFGTANEKALCGIQAEWTRTDASFPVRVAHLLGGKGSLSTVHFILKGPHRNVFSGGDKDLLDGGSGWNWFLCNVRGKGVQDRVRRLAHDRVSDL
jgi:Ca2+-binding RTX toxin-like protein